MYLGSESLIERVTRAVRPRADRAIPRQQREPSRLTAEGVLQRVSRGYGLRVAALCAPARRPSEARQVPRYALRREAGLLLATIARLIGLGYTAVSRRVGAVTTRVALDRRFRHRMTAILDGKVKT